MDENILAPGRHVAEFKHIFEHFTTPMNAIDKQKKKDEDKKAGTGDDKDAFTKTTELHK